MENILKELQKLQIEINECEAKRNALVFDVSKDADRENIRLYNKIETNRKRMAEILLNETPVNDVEAA